MEKSHISRFKHLIFGVLIATSFLGCASNKNPQVVALDKKIENKKKEIEKIENNYTFPKIPEDLLEPMIYLPSWKEAQVKLLRKKITIKAINTPLKDILNLISQATNLDIVYIESKKRRIPLEEKKITITIKNKKIKDVLDILSKVANFHYKIEKGSIIISDMQTKIYDVGIPKVASQASMAINGNIFGSNENSISALSALDNTYTNIITKNPYENLKTAIRNLLSPYGKFYLDEDTGTLTVTDYPENIKKIDNLVQRFKYFYSKEIDVEITILDYSQDASLKNAINWQVALTKVLDNMNVLYKPLSISPDKTGLVISGTSVGSGPKLENAIIQFLNKIGNVKILSSPRIRLTNGYSAVIISGKIEPYWRKEIVNQNNGTSSYVYKSQNYIDGYVLLLKARVNEQNQIYLVLTPVKNEIIGKSVAGDGSEAPIFSTDVINTILKLHNGDVVVLGGLKKFKVNKNKESLPGIEDKLLNSLTSSNSNNAEEHEIIMIIRAKLVF